MGSQVFEIDLTTREACLRGLAESIGTCPPRSPVPPWWEAFESWFVGQRDKAREVERQEGEMPKLLVRTEAFTYDDEEDEVSLAEDPDAEQREPDSDDEPPTDDQVEIVI